MGQPRLVFVLLVALISAAGTAAVMCPRVALSRPQWLQPIARKDIGNIFFGHSLGMSGEHMAVGAYGLQDYRGAVYMYKLEGTRWSFQQALKPTDRKPSDHYGLNLGMSNRTVVIGRPFHNIQGTKSGSADVWVFNGRNWRRTQQLVPPGNGWGHGGAWYGYGVAAEGPFACIGARYQNKIVNGVITYPRAGAVYVYYRNNGVGTPYRLVQTLTGPNEVSFFGDEIKLYGFEEAGGEKRLLVGASRHSPDAKGAAYLYTRQDRQWKLAQKMSPADRYQNYTSQHYGEGIAMSNETILIGGETAPSDKGRRTGEVYAFKKVGEQWVQSGPLNPPEGVTRWGLHGQRLGTDQRFAAVGQWGTVVNGVNRAGSFSYYLRCSDGSWRSSKMRVMTSPQSHDSLGKNVLVKNGFMVVAAPMRDSGINADIQNRGLVMVFKYTLGGGPWVEYPD
mmetsp:Transcript_22247/g.89826  ORF Transcript_22247/g.89826 Transcript_22247/m.89826 type:complete len:448 (-) Transcript_22247:347-1690(-)|eukprot:CAMPEP_0113954356 /NCGR_PEP_ID=MMETSP0011_2-20120614/480_1 /TAXON_ID=101924 /ORGANISM="Rhodosorus marinus" /LENGTH=447 /DNA_ID=CAMNT_0000963421 /DNA_START=36 /DNA_END=1379 /DNA_ORIENTATION=+ /assembly_acc=CAM_ASM_000156